MVQDIPKKPIFIIFVKYFLNMFQTKSWTWIAFVVLLICYLSIRIHFKDGSVLDGLETVKRLMLFSNPLYLWDSIELFSSCSNRYFLELQLQSPEKMMNRFIL